ncbi:MAG: hypothetical protein GXC94_02065 [Comamonadaceae bacterium]|nr:hypothetical protein [Comamonadaceae bacterium]
MLDTSGLVTFSSVAHAGGALVDILVIPNNSQSGFKEYPGSHLTGRSLYCVLDRGGVHDTTSATVGGVPRVSWTRQADPSQGLLFDNTRLLVFAR